MSLCRPHISYGRPLDTIRNSTAKNTGLWYVQMKQYLRIDTSEIKLYQILFLPYEIFDLSRMCEKLQNDERRYY